jgi:transposase-like protein
MTERLPSFRPFSEFATQPAIKRRVRPMLGFKSMATARVILGGIEMVHMMRKEQARYVRNSNLSLAEQFELLAA